MGCVVKAYHKKHIQELRIQPTLKAYIQSIVLKKTLESISLERRRVFNQDEVGEEEMESAGGKLVDSSMREKECEEKSAQPEYQGITKDPEDPTIGEISISLDIQEYLNTMLVGKSRRWREELANKFNWKQIVNLQTLLSSAVTNKQIFKLIKFFFITVSKLSTVTLS